MALTSTFVIVYAVMLFRLRQYFLLSSALIALAAVLCHEQPCAAAETHYISDVIIEGNKRIDTGALRVQFKKTTGEFSAADVSESVKTIYRTGFFDQVTAKIVEVSGKPAKKYLKLEVVEKPIIRKVFITGNENVEESSLSPMFSFAGGRFFDKTQIQASIRQAISYYQLEGYYDAAFEYSVVPVTENQVDVTFTVSEGKRYKIREISIEGVKELDDDDILGVMQTKRYKWWNSWLLSTGRLNREMLENDRALVRQYLLDQGYLDGSVSEPSVDLREDGLYIALDVNEGQRYTIGEITASGDLIDQSEERTLDGIKSKNGETFSVAKIREDAFLISDKFGSDGHAFANVIPDTNVNSVRGTVDLDFKIEKGRQVSIDRIIIRGNQKSYDNVIRRELTIGEQEMYSSKKVKRSQELLTRTGYFEEASISTSPTDDPSKVNLDVNVREGSTGVFTVGAGYSSSDGAIVTGRITENNLFGRGRRLDFSADLGAERETFIVSLLDRRFRDGYWSVGADLIKTEREYSDFDRDISGGGLSAAYPLEQIFEGEWAQDISFGTKYEYLDVEISNVDKDDAAQLVIDSEGRTTSSSVTPKLSRNTINNLLNPTRGSRQEVSVELAGLGGEEEFYLVEIEQQLYWPILGESNDKWVFSWRTNVGYGESYTGDPLPLFRRYFPGGINSVRGFENRSLGPKDDDGNEFGGAKQIVNNLEIIFPLFTSAGFKGVVFYDAGEAFDDDESIDIGALRQAVGYGLRWLSPIGPLRFEVGYPIDREEGEDSVVTMFSFGAPL